MRTNDLARSRGRTMYLALAACMMIGAVAAGCKHELGDIETITLTAGNAGAANRAIHAIDPWPPSAFSTWQPTDGERIAKAYDRYRGEDAAAVKSKKRTGPKK